MTNDELRPPDREEDQGDEKDETLREFYRTLVDHYHEAGYQLGKTVDGMIAWARFGGWARGN